MKKVVLIRLDKIGDLIATIPVDQAPFLKGADITWVISKGLGFIPQNSDPIRKFIELDKADAKNSFWSLYHFLKKENPDVAVSFQAPWWVSLALFLTGVKVRGGVKSQWHSFLFLNKALRQKRSGARQHEADYNADLLAYTFDELEKRMLSIRNSHGGHHSPILFLKAPLKLDLKRYGLESQSFVIVHPGMAGSALNWPAEQYISLIKELTNNQKVVLTGTKGDEKWLAPIKQSFFDNSKVVNLQNQLSPDELMALITEAKCVVCPSTGVAHIAASLGAHVVGLYSPIKVQHPKRWGARGNDVDILLPQVDCPAHFRCLGPKCPSYFCMNKISIQEVLDKVNRT